MAGVQCSLLVCGCWLAESCTGSSLCLAELSLTWAKIGIELADEFLEGVGMWFLSVSRNLCMDALTRSEGWFVEVLQDAQNLISFLLCEGKIAITREVVRYHRC